MKEKLYILLIIIVLAAPLKLYSQEQGGNENDEDCEYNIYPETHTIHLGAFFVNTTTSNLPGIGGTGNSMVFRLKGSYTDTYQIETYLSTSVNSGNGEIKIDHWSWKKSNPSNGQWESAEVNDDHLNETVNLYNPPGDNECDSYIRFKLLIKQITVGYGVVPGKFTLNVIVSAQLVNI